VIRPRQIDPFTLILSLVLLAVTIVLWTRAALRFTIDHATEIPYFIGSAIVLL